MNNFLSFLLQPSSQHTTTLALAFLRITIGLLTIGHGLPKIMGGVSEWRQLGTFVQPLGIYFWPLMWGFLGAATEFFGGIAFTLGLGTRLASACLTLMMFVATVWHLHRGDSFNLYSFPLSLMMLYIAFVIMGGGHYSIDYYLTNH